MIVKVKLLSRAWLFVTPWIVACTKLLRPWDFQGKSTGVGCHFLLQGTSQPRDQTQVSHIVDKPFTIWATRKVQVNDIVWPNYDFTQNKIGSACCSDTFCVLLTKSRSQHWTVAKQQLVIGQQRVNPHILCFTKDISPVLISTKIDIYV